MQQWWGCGVLMVVVWGFWVCSQRCERERETETRGKREIIIANIYIYIYIYIYFIVWIYYFNILNRDIKVEILGVL